MRLTSGSDYANLADVLEQTCQDFVTGALHGFTQDHCTNIGRAITATQLRTTPTPAPQPANAPMTCPGGVTPSLLFDSETGSASSPGPPWLQGGQERHVRARVPGTPTARPALDRDQPVDGE